VTRALVLAIALALAPAAAAAHALDEYVQATRVWLSPRDVALELDLTPGTNVAASILAMIDRNRDGLVSPDEAAAYGARVLAEITVALDGRPVTMTLTRADVPPVGVMREGMGTIRLTAVGAHGLRLAGAARVSLRNDHAPDGSVYAVNAMVPADRSLSVVRQERDVYQRSIEIVYDVRPTGAARAAWIAFAIVSCGVLPLARRRSFFSRLS
jgi:hypothetical protein